MVEWGIPETRDARGSLFCLGAGQGRSKTFLGRAGQGVKSSGRGGATVKLGTFSGPGRARRASLPETIMQNADALTLGQNDLSLEDKSYCIGEGYPLIPDYL